MRQPKPTMPAENMAAILFAALKRHSNLTSYVDHRAERGRPFSDVILHGHFDLNAIAADLVKEVSSYKRGTHRAEGAWLDKGSG